MDILSSLKEIKEFDNVPEDQLKWLESKSACLTIPQGEHLFKPGQDINRLLIILEGKILLKVPQNNQFRIMDVLEKHSITGLLPYSRATKSFAYAEASAEAHVLVLDKDHFVEMIHDCYELTTALVHVMSTRIRNFTKTEQQNDKMMALGKLSAGLAHELNNPSAAVIRSSRELSKQLKTLPEKLKNVVEANVSDEQIESVNKMIFDKLDKTVKLSLMERSALEDDMMDWLDEHHVKDSDEIAANFVQFGLTEEDLGDIHSLVGDVCLNPLIGWLNQILTTEKLVAEIEEASKRINDLVCSIKSYTHMDQAQEKTSMDIHEGINNTLTMLNHKIKKNGIELIRKFDESLPHPEILPSQMNQVWTNIIDNAIDAMENAEKKVLEIETKKDEKYVLVNICDSGAGIPADIKDNIFDPFVTTKPIGKGTGLGLEVVHQIVTRQHNGNIMVESEPGKTLFSIYIPIKAS